MRRTCLQEAAFQLYRPVLAGIAPPPRPPAANGIAGQEESAGKEEGEEEGEIAEPVAADNGASLLASAAPSAAMALWLPSPHGPACESVVRACIPWSGLMN